MTDDKLSVLQRDAVRAGADGAVPVAAQDVVVAEWVRLKCAYGCDAYGVRLGCPPNAPQPRDFRAVLAEYSSAALVWVDVPSGPPESASDGGDDRDAAARRRLAEALLAMERDALLTGRTKAFAVVAGPCVWCGDEPCPADGTCRHRELLRPSLAACGVDVFATAATAGLQLRVARVPDGGYRLVGLLLIE